MQEHVRDKTPLSEKERYLEAAVAVIIQDTPPRLDSSFIHLSYKDIRLLLPVLWGQMELRYPNETLTCAKGSSSHVPASRQERRIPAHLHWCSA